MTKMEYATRLHMTWRPIFFSLLLIMFTSGCVGSQPEPVAEVTPVPDDVEILDIREEEETERSITQTKTFDQCESAGPFNASISFGSSESSEAQRELVLNVEGGGSYGLSSVAEAEVSAGIQNRYQEARANIQRRGEEVNIEVPAHTRQEYTIVWNVKRRTGTVEYREGDQQRTANYDYRIGWELESTKVKDLPCPTPEGVIATPSPTQPPLPTYTPPPTQTPLPTYTAVPQPTDTPRPTATSGPTATPHNRGLEVGEWYTQGNVSVGLLEVDYDTSPSVQIDIRADIKNVSNHTISFQYDSSNFRLVDNLGNSYAPKSTSPESVVLEPGEIETNLSPGLCCGVFFELDFTNPQITEFVFIVQNLSSVEYAEWSIPVHH